MTRDRAAIHGGARLRSAIILLALGGLLCACGKSATGPESEIRNWVARGVVAVEAEERGTLMDMISPAYADTRGYNRARVDDTLRVYFLRMNAIELITSIDEIELMGDTAAEVLLTVAMAGKRDSLLGFSADAYQFSLELEKNRGDWQLLSARWGEFGKELK